MNIRPHLLVTAFAATLFAQPPVIVTDGIRNSASYANRGMLHSGIAQGSLFVLFGRNMGPAGLVQAAYPLPTELAGVSVRVTAGGTDYAAFLSYVSAGQIGALLPSAVPQGNATIAVRYNGQTSETQPVVIGRVKPGFFTRNQAGTGPVIAQNFISQDNQPLNSLLEPARPGQVVTLWGTGLGPVTGNEAAGPLPGGLQTSLKYLIGGKEAKILYEGRSGCCAGVDQVVLEIPAGITGCYVPVVAASTIRSGHAAVPREGPSSNYVTIAISENNTPCSDALGLTGQELTRLQQSASWNVAALALSRTPEFDESRKLSDHFTAQFGQYPAARLLAENGIFGLPPAGTCIAASLPAQAAPVRLLDAGTLSLAGAGGSKTVSRKGSGEYQQDLGSTFLSPGSLKITSDGGADIGKFETEISVPAPVSWTNRGDFRMTATLPPIRWSGGDSNSFAVLTNESYSNFTGLGIVCVERTTAGTIDIPLDQPLVQIGYDGPFGSAPDLTSISIVPPPVRFQAPGLDLGLLYVSIASDSFYRR